MCYNSHLYNATQLTKRLHFRKTPLSSAREGGIHSFIHQTFARPDHALPGAGSRPTRRQGWGARSLEQVQRIKL